MMPTLRAWCALVWLSFRRLLWSGSTLMALVPLIGCAAVAWARNFDRNGFSPQAFDNFSRWFLTVVFVSVVIPLVALAFGTAGVGGDREDRTLLFLLIRPLPRPLVLLAKFAGMLPLALGLVVIGFWINCKLAGSIGAVAFDRYLPAVVLTTLAYLGLFQLFAVSFRHATVVALIYALFMELFLGNVPGIIKRVAVNYYGRSLMFAAGRADGFEPPDSRIFEPIASSAAETTLLGFAAIGLLASLIVFERREFRDLT